MNKIFPARNVNLEIEAIFLRDNRLTEADLNSSVLKNPAAKCIMLKVYRELLTDDDFSGHSIKMLLLGMARADRKSRPPKAPPRWISALKEVLNDRWNERLSLKDLSQAVGVHPVTDSCPTSTPGSEIRSRLISFYSVSAPIRYPAA